MYKQKILAHLRDYLQHNDLADVAMHVDYPADPTHGDYSTNLALVLSKQLGKAPREIAQEIVTVLTPVIDFATITIAGPGFINFTLTPAALEQYLTTPSAQLETAFSGKKVMVEYTDPNPFKELHIGHLYSNIVGESIARILAKNGAEVKRACYQGDVGLHVAKSLWGMKQLLQKEQKTIQQFEAGLSTDEHPKPPILPALAQKAKFLGEAYALGATAFEDDAKAKDEIIAINKQVYQKDPAIMELYDTGKAWSLAYFDSIYRILGTKFDYMYFESEVGETGMQLVKEYLKKGVFEESDGAVIFPGEQYGLHSRVFINSLGLPTYEAKELGLAPRKYADYPYDLSVIITGNEVNAYFSVLLKALAQIKPELAEKTKHFSHGMVRLPEGKMSSRKGNVITGMSLVNEATTRIGVERYELTMDEYFTNPQWKTALQIGLGAVKYALLKSGVGKDVEFSFAESISVEGNSGPYLQYTYVRTQSVLKKAEHGTKGESSPVVLTAEEMAVLRHLIIFEEIVQLAGEQYSPNTIATYLYELAQKFNNFYQKNPILESTQQTFRLALTKKVGETLKEGLSLLGIEAPERM